MRLIPLTQGFVAAVSNEDYLRVMQYKWHASIESRGTKVYAVRRETVNGKRVKIRMHRYILGLPPNPGPNDPVVDHDNDDSLDNRRENLIVRTQAENMAKVPRWKRKGKKAA